VLLVTSNQLPATSYAHFETHIVKMTPNGFEPQIMKLDVNSAVIFVNQDTNERWPASNTHPTHEIYPEFDPKQPIASGGSWAFKPKNAGTFKFHDHLFPHMRGTLEVTSEDGQTVIKTTKAWDTEFKDWFVYLVKKFKLLVFGNQNIPGEKFKSLTTEQQISEIQKMAENQEIDQVWRYFTQTFTGDPGSRGNIHDLAHLIGGLIYQKNGFAGLGICTPEYAFGCYHGFLDKAFQKNLDNLFLAEQSCRAISAQSGPFASCVHGIGHGIASFYQTSDLKTSILECQKLKEGQDFCFDGVLMEFSRSAPQSFYSKENPYAPCGDLEAEFGPTLGFACGRNQGTVLTTRFNFSRQQIIAVCLASPSIDFQNACIDSLGYDAARSSNDPPGIFNQCQDIQNKSLVARCARAAAGELVFQNIVGWSEKSQQVCHLLKSDYQLDCQSYIQELAKQYGR